MKARKTGCCSTQKTDVELQPTLPFGTNSSIRAENVIELQVAASVAGEISASKFYCSQLDSGLRGSDTFPASRMIVSHRKDKSRYPARLFRSAAESLANVTCDCHGDAKCLLSGDVAELLPGKTDLANDF